MREGDCEREEEKDSESDRDSVSEVEKEADGSSVAESEAVRVIVRVMHLSRLSEPANFVYVYFGQLMQLFFVVDPMMVEYVSFLQRKHDVDRVVLAYVPAMQVC